MDPELEKVHSFVGRKLEGLEDEAQRECKEPMQEVTKQEVITEVKADLEAWKQEALEEARARIRRELRAQFARPLR